MTDIVKELRTNKKLTCEQMANLIGVSKATYSKKENGLIKFSLKESKIIADEFNKSIEDIFFNSIVSKIETKKEVV
ncbi:helix-turn-helix transcriptional regulator [Clostridium sp. WILCCON 0269]|uniref:Helix-turn-helix transcriptional regulator n=1 Tax=Candidatus Clostridium eludens TaxID=3381663 RepID=A0ABW8SK77_9CLOT